MAKEKNPGCSHDARCNAWHDNQALLNRRVETDMNALFKSHNDNQKVLFEIKGKIFSMFVLATVLGGIVAAVVGATAAWALSR